MGTAIYRREKIRPEKAGSRFPGFIPYRKKNDKGVSVHAGSAFYDHKPITLKLYTEYGGVCGAVSKGAAGFLRSKGVPAYPIGQPGHCAFVWETPQWPLANRQQSRRLELGQRRRSDSLARPCSTGDGLRFIHSSSSCGRIGFNVLSVLLHTKTGTCGVALAGSASI